MSKALLAFVLLAAMLLFPEKRATADSLLVTTNVTVGLDTYSAIVRYSPSGAVIGQYMDRGFLSELAGIAVDSKGNIYVANDGYGEIDEISPEGMLEATFDTFSSGIQGIAVDQNGDVFVNDNENDLLGEYLPNGGYQTLSLGGIYYGGLAIDDSDELYQFTDGSISRMRPFGNSYFVASLVAAPGFAIDNAGNTYCIENGNDLGTVDALYKISRFGVSTEICAMPRISSDSVNNELGMAVDGEGNVYVANAVLGLIYKITPRGACSVFARVDGPAFLAWDSTSASTGGSKSGSTGGGKGGPAGRITSP